MWPKVKLLRKITKTFPVSITYHKKYFRHRKERLLNVEQFDLVVKLLSGALVFIAFKSKIYPPIAEKLRVKFIKPHDDLNATCDNLKKEMNDRFKKIEDDNNLQNQGLVALLHDRVYNCCQRHLKAGEISIMDKKNLDHVYEAYHDLGGNGTCQDLYEQVCALKIKIEEGEII